MARGRTPPSKLLRICSLIYLFALAPHTASAQLDTGVITIHVVSSFGTIYKDRLVKLTVPDNEKAVLFILRTDVGIRVPYGRYLAVVSLTEARSLKRYITVDRPRALYTLGIASSYIGSRLENVRGKVIVKGSSTGRNLWVRVLSLFTDFIQDSSVSPDLEFELWNVPDGEYILTVVQSSGVNDRVVVVRRAQFSDSASRDLRIELAPDQ
jgi:hypothetical protein